MLERTLTQARSSVIIVSPYAALRRICCLESALTAAQNREVSVTIYTRPVESFNPKADSQQKLPSRHWPRWT